MKSRLYNLLKSETKGCTDQDKIILTFLDKLTESMQNATVNQIYKKINTFFHNLSPEEQLQFDYTMNLAGGALIKLNKKRALHWIDNLVFEVIRIFFYKKIRTHKIWKGVPDIIDSEILDAFQKEGRAQRKEAFRRHSAFVASPGDVASQIIQSEWVQSKVKKLYPKSEFSGCGTYIYYETTGDYVRPHVDVGEFLINVLFCVEHDSAGTSSQSSTVIYGQNYTFSDIKLCPGEMLLFPAGTLFHSRIPIKKSERVTIFTSGFRHSLSAYGGLT